MPRLRILAHYEQLSEFERCRIIGLKEGMLITWCDNWKKFGIGIPQETIRILYHAIPACIQARGGLAYLDRGEVRRNNIFLLGKAFPKDVAQGFEPLVPFALKGRVENEIDRLDRKGIIKKVDSSEWVTPVVPVVKTDGSIRLSMC
ncbi:hypothetical protein TNCV_5007911 [Trichonephila clavipes]|nr:hypothetical protein TNCV_5007911 [Trichonephila clavipes]